tara:strand:- start:545 stop:940 length:396 start_codon:yes stop_codon:yes gene_type:complete
MGINSTNRIIDPRKEARNFISIELEQIERRKRAKKRNNFKFFIQPTVHCSQCDRGMRKDIAKQQIENKRENAPICIPCIIGIPRKKLTKNFLPKHFSKETVKEFKKFKSRIKKEKELKVIPKEESPFVGFY